MTTTVVRTDLLEPNNIIHMAPLLGALSKAGPPGIIRLCQTMSIDALNWVAPSSVKLKSKN